MDWKKILLLAICCSCMNNASFAIGEIPTGAMDAVGGVQNLNVHDMDRLKDLQRREEQEQDWQDLKRRQKEQKESPDKVKSKKEKKKDVIKARAEEYATKGVYIDKIRVAPSEILTQEEIENIISDYQGENLTFDKVKEIINRINTLYLEKGFVTAKAFVPEQDIVDGSLYIDLFVV